MKFKITLLSAALLLSCGSAFAAHMNEFPGDSPAERADNMFLWLKPNAVNHGITYTKVVDRKNRMDNWSVNYGDKDGNYNYWFSSLIINSNSNVGCEIEYLPNGNENLMCSRNLENPLLQPDISSAAYDADQEFPFLIEVNKLTDPGVSVNRSEDASTVTWTVNYTDPTSAVANAFIAAATSSNMINQCSMKTRLDTSKVDVFTCSKKN